jgi:asparagine synthetase B (glutamine-hydrolysing)
MMRQISIPAIPQRPTILKQEAAQANLNLEAICVFAALGFFLDKDTYFRNEIALQPGTTYEVDQKGSIVFERKDWQWFYAPKSIGISEAVDEFADIFSRVIQREVGDKQVILPTSGGLDSRTLAAALQLKAKQVKAFSYQFLGGHDETYYANEIAKACDFDFERWEIAGGYLWDHIDTIAAINGCYSEFTHPRQLAFMDRYASMGDVFVLGHWGDVLFDGMGVSDHLSDDQIIDFVQKKVVKKGGIELASALWIHFGLNGDFESYLKNRLELLLREIKIDHAGAKIRAFKSLYWAPRWTSVNTLVFEHVRPIVVPYYDQEICDFVCRTPESLLDKRQIQIDYLKKKAPALAKIMWQEHKPFNLYNYHWNKVPYNLPYRALKKVERSIDGLFSRKLVQRNWELQFLGEENDRQLRTFLFDNKLFQEFIDPKLVDSFYNKFKHGDVVWYSHPLSILLTISVFCKKFLKR